MDTTQDQAVRLLGEADRAGREVERRAPKEYVPFIGWGLFNAIVIPGFDVFDPRVWGLVTIGIAVAGVVATLAYFAIRSARVEVKMRSPWWTWPVLGLWGALASFAAPALEDDIGFAYTLAGWIAAVPLLAWALHLRKRA